MTKFVRIPYIPKPFEAYGPSRLGIQDFLTGKLIIDEPDHTSPSSASNQANNAKIVILLSAFADHGVEFSSDLAMDIGNAFRRNCVRHALESRAWYRDAYLVLDGHTPSESIVEQIGAIKREEDEPDEYEPESDSSVEGDGEEDDDLQLMQVDGDPEMLWLHVFL